MNIAKKTNSEGMPQYNIEGLTLGKLMAIKAALEKNTTPVGNDVLLLLNRAFEKLPKHSDENFKMK